jgi:enoyl reductase
VVGGGAALSPRRVALSNRVSPVRAVVFDSYGPPSVLRIAEVDVPEPAAGQVRVRVRAAGVNPVDAKRRRGDFASTAPATFPQRLGNEYAGLVDGVGTGVRQLRAGDPVLGSATAQCYADYVIVEGEHAVAKPAQMSWEAAAGLPAAGQTASVALDAIDLRAGETIVIHAAAGGVGTIAVQFARMRGAIVIGTARPANHDYLRELGAIPVTYGPGLTDRIVKAAAGSVDAALDLVGGDAIKASLELVPDRTRIATTVDATAAREHGIQRVGGRSTNALRELVDAYRAGRLVLPEPLAYPLERAADAHTHIESGHVRGKLVLQIPGDFLEPSRRENRLRERAG